MILHQEGATDIASLHRGLSTGSESWFIGMYLMRLPASMKEPCYMRLNICLPL